MKKISLIETYPDGLRTIKSYLSDMNARFLVYGSVSVALKEREGTDLVVLLAARNRQHFLEDLGLLQNDAVYGKVPRIIVLPAEYSESMQITEIGERQTSLRIPVEKLQFLTTAATLMKVPPRRVMQMVVTIQLEGSSVRYTGVSVDFSESGMAFESDAVIPLGQKVSITFINPSSRQRFFLNAEVVRTVPAKTHGRNFFGVKFHSLTAQEAKEMSSFVTGTRL